jgi:FAD synthetase
MIKVMAFGSFDLIHPGHVSFLIQAKSFGNELIVVVSHDESSKKIKGKKPVNSQNQRALIVASLQMVDKVILGKNENFFNVIKRVKPQIIALGYDQKQEEKKLLEKIKENKLKIKIKRCAPFKEKEFKSSKIKEKIKLN